MNASSLANAQDIPLLATKLYVPLPPRSNLVSRPRLIERLDQGFRQGRKLTLVSAPAGFGKTTLLSEWVASAVSPSTSLRMLRDPSPRSDGQRFAWLSLDEADDDLARFLTYLVAALQQIDEGIGVDVQAVLRHPQSPPSTAADGSASPRQHWGQAVMTALINDLARSAQGSPLVLVLDDYHNISDIGIHEAIGLLLDRQPPHLHLAIATRQDPPLSLSRLRARGQVTEIRQRDLQFTPQEAADFYLRAVGQDLAASDVAVLEDRTEGWIAGLQLAALSMRGRDAQGTAQFIQGFSGRYAFVLDYLTDEVLQRQPEPIQQFLLQTSILERMCGPLCDAVMGTGERGEGGGSADLPNSQAILEYLEHANLFVVPLDDERRWYRYHRLFGELLRARLLTSSPSLGEKTALPPLRVSPPVEGRPAGNGGKEIRELHRRAATWYEQNGLPADAVHHALAAQDYSTAADIVERAIQRVSVWSRLNVATFMGWFHALPDDIARARPRLQLFASRVYYVTRQPEETDRILQHILDYLRDNPDTPGAEGIRDLVAADRASYAAVRGDVHEAIALARQILERLSAENAPMRMRMASILGLAHLRAGDLDEARQAFTESVATARALGLAFAAAPLVCNLADIQFVQGRLREAAETCEQATQMGTVDGVPISVTGYAGLEMAKILYEQNDLQNAERHVSEGLERLAQGGTPDSFGVGHVVLARIKQAQGDDQAALAAIQHAVQVAQDSRIPRAVHLTSAHRARIWLAQGRLEQASRWADEYRQVGETAYLREVEDLALARVLLAQGEPPEALALLEGLLSPAKAAGRLGHVVEIQALRALALDALAQASKALDALARALVLAEPEGYVRVFLDQGEPMRKLLLAVTRAPIPGGEGAGGHQTSHVTRHTSHVSVGYVGALLAAFGAEAAPLPTATTIAGPPSSLIDRQPLIEPLTDREREVLCLLAEGLTNPEIGQRLYISLPTVKTHTRNIYGKLGVHGRKEAVQEARVLGILPPV